MRLAKATPKQIESASSIRGALKQIEAPKTRPDNPDADPVIEAVMKKATALGIHPWPGEAAIEAMGPQERWDLEDKIAELRETLQESMTPFERYWLKHKGLVSDERKEDIEDTCEIAGAVPLFERMPDDHSSPWVWVGFFPGTDKDGQPENPLTFHPGWASYCRHVLGDGVSFATDELMPYRGDDWQPNFARRNLPAAEGGDDA